MPRCSNVWRFEIATITQPKNRKDFAAMTDEFNTILKKTTKGDRYTPIDHDLETALCVRAEAGDLDDRFMLGMIYEHGDRVPQDYEEAARWYRMAAEEDHPEAQRRLAHFYSVGLGVPQDDAEAAYWNERAAAFEETA